VDEVVLDSVVVADSVTNGVRPGALGPALEEARLDARTMDAARSTPAKIPTANIPDLMPTIHSPRCS
jgi:hypothetical protein